jgi:hypothetical protein
MNALIYQIVAIAMALAVHVPKQPPPIPFEVLNVASGNDSLMERPYQAIVSDRDAWSRVWAMHKGPPTFGSLANPDGVVPTLDFEKSYVIAIFLGSATGVEGLSVIDVVSDEKQNRIDLQPSAFPGSETVVGNPFGFIQISKSNLPVEVRLRVGNQFRILGTFSPPKPTGPPKDSRD